MEQNKNHSVGYFYNVVIHLYKKNCSGRIAGSQLKHIWGNINEPKL